jgi:acyl-CoA synthetase (AMP-forming)/AMP-acid ligase II
MNIGYLLTRSARYYGDRPAFVFDKAKISYRQLHRRVNRLANGLLELGLKKGDRVGLLFNNCLEYLESYLALYEAGLVWVRLNSRLSVKELKRMVEDSGARVLIRGKEFESQTASFKNSLQTVIHVGPGPNVVYEDFVMRAKATEPTVDVTLDDLSDIWYTSGTTGEAKGIMLTHRNILTCTQLLLSEVYPITSQSRFLTPGALSHAASVRILPFIIRGATCYLHQHFDPGRIFSQIEQDRISDLATVPTMLIALLDAPERTNFNLSSLERITYAGSPLTVERIKEALEVFGMVLDQSFGQAESIITITHLPREEHDWMGDSDRERRLSSVGREYPGVRVLVVDENDQVLPAGQIGEVVTRSDLVMKGYWNRPELNAEVLRNGWLHTGDMGYQDAAGYLFLVDRKHDMIITGGLNLYPREVEEVLAAHSAVAQVCVFSRKDAYWGEAVTAAVVTRPGRKVGEAEIKAFAKQHLAHYKCPKKVVFMSELPQNSYGKVLRKVLRERQDI